MHVLISGPSGSGKTSITNELATRGLSAFDADEVPGLARLELRATGEPAEWPTSGFVDWKKYGWNLQEQKLHEVLSASDEVFLSGICGNQPDFYHLFGKLIVLTTSPEAYLQQMRDRPYRGANDDEVNIQARAGKYETKIQEFIDAGFTPVDNSGPIALTTDKILQIVHGK